MSDEKNERPRAAWTPHELRQAGTGPKPGLDPIFLRLLVQERLIVDRLDAALRRFQVGQAAAVDDEIGRMLYALGLADAALEPSPLQVSLHKHFDWSEKHLDKMKRVVADLHLDADLVYDAWVKEGGDLEILDPTAYALAFGEPRPADSSFHEGREQPDYLGAVGRYRGKPLVFEATAARNAGNWHAVAKGEAAADFLTEWMSRVERMLVERYRGKVLNHQLREIDLKTHPRSSLVYPKALGRKVDELIVCFRNWCRSPTVPRWGYTLIGAPGTGKTTVGGLIIAEKPADVTFLYCPAGEIGSVNEINEIFRMARLLAPTILQIDDVDLIAKSRENGDDAEFTSALMENLDGLEENARIFTIFTTNDPASMDDAVINRAGRVSNKIVFEGFGECFEELLVRYLDAYKLTAAPAAARKAARTAARLVKDFTPDEVKNICQRLALLHGGETVDQGAVLRAIKETHEAFHGKAAKRSFVGRKLNGHDRPGVREEEEPCYID